MTILGVDVSARDVLLTVLAAPLVLVGLWSGLSLIYAVVPG